MTANTPRSTEYTVPDTGSRLARYSRMESPCSQSTSVNSATKQEDKRDATHAQPATRCGRHRQTPHGPSRRKHDNHEHDGHLHQLGNSCPETWDQPEEADGSKEKACPEDEGEIEESSFCHLH